MKDVLLLHIIEPIWKRKVKDEGEKAFIGMGGNFMLKMIFHSRRMGMTVVFSCFKLVKCCC